MNACFPGGGPLGRSRDEPDPAGAGPLEDPRESVRAVPVILAHTRATESSEWMVDHGFEGGSRGSFAPVGPWWHRSPSDPRPMNGPAVAARPSITGRDLSLNDLLSFP